MDVLSGSLALNFMKKLFTLCVWLLMVMSGFPNSYTGQFIGNGSGLTNLPPTAIQGTALTTMGGNGGALTNVNGMQPLTAQYIARMGPNANIDSASLDLCLSIWAKGGILPALNDLYILKTNYGATATQFVSLRGVTNTVGLNIVFSTYNFGVHFSNSIATAIEWPVNVPATNTTIFVIRPQGLANFSLFDRIVGGLYNGTNNSQEVYYHGDWMGLILQTNNVYSAGTATNPEYPPAIYDLRTGTYGMNYGNRRTIGWSWSNNVIAQYDGIAQATNALTPLTSPNYTLMHLGGRYCASGAILPFDCDIQAVVTFNGALNQSQLMTVDQGLRQLDDSTVNYDYLGDSLSTPYYAGLWGQGWEYRYMQQSHPNVSTVYYDGYPGQNDTLVTNAQYLANTIIARAPFGKVKQTVQSIWLGINGGAPNSTATNVLNLNTFAKSLGDTVWVFSIYNAATNNVAYGATYYNATHSTVVSNVNTMLATSPTTYDHWFAIDQWMGGAFSGPWSNTNNVLSYTANGADGLHWSDFGQQQIANWVAQQAASPNVDSNGNSSVSFSQLTQNSSFQNLSASSLTAGTLSATNVTVTNLLSGSLSVGGTISGNGTGINGISSDAYSAVQDVASIGLSSNLIDFVSFCSGEGMTNKTWAGNPLTLKSSPLFTYLGFRSVSPFNGGGGGQILFNCNIPVSNSICITWRPIRTRPAKCFGVLFQAINTNNNDMTFADYQTAAADTGNGEGELALFDAQNTFVWPITLSFTNLPLPYCSGYSAAGYCLQQRHITIIAHDGNGNIQVTDNGITNLWNIAAAPNWPSHPTTALNLISFGAYYVTNGVWLNTYDSTLTNNLEGIIESVSLWSTTPNSQPLLASGINQLVQACTWLADDIQPLTGINIGIGDSRMSGSSKTNNLFSMLQTGLFPNEIGLEEFTGGAVIQNDYFITNQITMFNPHGKIKTETLWGQKSYNDLGPQSGQTAATVEGWLNNYWVTPLNCAAGTKLVVIGPWLSWTNTSGGGMTAAQFTQSLAFSWFCLTSVPCIYVDEITLVNQNLMDTNRTGAASLEGIHFNNPTNGTAAYKMVYGQVYSKIYGGGNPYVVPYLTPQTFVFPATTVNWTNVYPSAVQVFIDNNGVTGTSIKRNGVQYYAGTTTLPSLVLPLNPGEYFSETYTVGTPVGSWMINE